MFLLQSKQPSQNSCTWITCKLYYVYNTDKVYRLNRQTEDNRIINSNNKQPGHEKVDDY